MADKKKSTKKSYKIPGVSVRAQWARRLVREELHKELVILNRKKKFGTIPGYDGELPIQDPFHLPSDPTQTGPSAPGLKAPDAAVPESEWPELKACIVGAGAAGLYIAMILDSLDIPNLSYDILESSDRIGGRINTYYFVPPGEDKTGHQYYDVGAMRFPKIPIMERTFDLFRRVGIQDREIPYILGPPEAVKNPQYFNDILYVQGDPEHVDQFQVSIANGGVVPDSAVAIGPDNILEEVFGEYKEALAENWERGFAKLMTVDEFSTREYIRQRSPFNDYYTINWLETMGSATGLYDQAFSESVIDSFDFDSPEPQDSSEQWVCIDGGSSLITDGMLEAIKEKPERAKRVKAIAIDRLRPTNANMVVEVASEASPRIYSTVFNTTSLACTQRMDLRHAELHSVQRDALRELHYDSSSKVAIRFKTPWWITRGGIVNGGTGSTDWPIRTCVYPSYNLHDGPENPAVLLCSYTWSQDAQRIGGLIAPDGHGVNDELLEVVLRDLARLHSHIITYDELLEGVMEYNAFDWYGNPNTSGAFALFGPGQFSRLYPYLIRPTADGNLHFVGEATSTHHAWVVGALDSAWRAVYNFLKKYQMEDGPMRPHWAAKIKELELKWGTIDEMETDATGTAHLEVILGRLKPDEQVRV